MGYADISKRHITVAPQATPVKVEQRKGDVVRFKVGTIYQCRRSKWVCVNRTTNDSGDVIWLAELNHHRRNLKNFWNDDIADFDHEYVDYDDECCEDWFGIHSVRTFDGIEYASPVDDVEEIEELSRPQQGSDGRYDFDDVEEIDKRKFEFRADKSCGEEPLNPPEQPPEKKPKKRKSKRGNPIAGLITVAVIILLIRACTSV